MIFKSKKGGPNSDNRIFLTDRSSLSLSISDISKIYNYVKYIGVNSEYVFHGEEQDSKYLRLKINNDYIQTTIRKAFIDEEEIINYPYPLLNIFIGDEILHLELFTKYDEVDNNEIEYIPVKIISLNWEENKDVLSIELDEDLDEFYKRPANNFLLKWRTYIDSKLCGLDEKKEKIYSTIDLEELRKNYDYWKSISENDDDRIYFPVRLKELGNINSVSLIVEKSKNDDLITEDLLNNFNASYSIVNKADTEDIKKVALENYEYTIETSIAYIESDDLTYDNLEILKKLNNRNIISASIKQNIRGESAVLKRIVNGIDNLLDKVEISPRLISQVLNNNVVDNYNYKLSDEDKDYYKKKYPILNEEQIIAVDKVLKMNDILLIQGPPGTGKTEIISTVVKELNKYNKKILLTSNVHEARRNIISRIKGEKEVIIKDFTLTNDSDPRYEIEVSKNMIQYFNNQVLEKFKYNNTVIDDSKKYEKIINDYEIAKDKLKYIDDMITTKDKTDNTKSKKEKNIEELIIVENNYNDKRNDIYNLLLNGNIEKLDKTILRNELDQYIYSLNETNLTDLIKEYKNNLKLIKQYEKSEDIDFKLNFLNNYDLDDNNKKKIIYKEFINAYCNSSSIKKHLFKYSKYLPFLKISNISIQEIDKILSENEKIINKIDFSKIDKEFLDLESNFLEYLSEKQQEIKNEIEILNVEIVALIGKINEEKNNNYGLKKEVDNLKIFIDGFNELKKHYKNEDLFYDYIINISELVNKTNIEQSEEFSNNYYEKMLSSLYFRDKFYCNDSKGGMVLSMTTSQVANLLKFNPTIFFDYIIIDEASKCNFNDLIVSLPRTKKLVLIGDYLQLDPVPPREEEEPRPDYISAQEWKSIHSSNFSQIIKPKVDKHLEEKIENFDTSNAVGVLKRQYRMGKDIFELTNKIYDSIPGFTLIDGKNDITNPLDNKNNLLVLQCDGAETQIDTGYWNSSEVEMIHDIFLKIVDLILKNIDIEIKNIGVISFYRKQANKIRNRLDKEIRILNQNNISVKIGTVDNFQGREFDLVIISPVRTNDINGWMANLRRWNVAISRAKNKLIIVGHFNQLYEISLAKLRKISEEDENIIVHKEIIKYCYLNQNKFSSIESIIEEFIGGIINE